MTSQKKHISYFTYYKENTYTKLNIWTRKQSRKKSGEYHDWVMRNYPHPVQWGWRLHACTKKAAYQPPDRYGICSYGWMWISYKMSGYLRLICKIVSSDLAQASRLLYQQKKITKQFFCIIIALTNRSFKWSTQFENGCITWLHWQAGVGASQQKTSMYFTINHWLDNDELWVCLIPRYP